MRKSPLEHFPICQQLSQTLTATGGGLPVFPNEEIIKAKKDGGHIPLGSTLRFLGKPLPSFTSVCKVGLKPTQI